MINNLLISIIDCAKEVDAPLFQVQPLPPGSSLGIQGDHQRVNAALALALSQAYNNVRRGKSPIEDLQPLLLESPLGSPSSLPCLDVNPLLAKEPSLAEGLQRCRWPGRCQVVHRNDCPSLTLFLDGAHTEQSVELAVRWYDDEHRKLDPSAQAALIFHCNTEKVVVDLFKHLVWDTQTDRPRFHHVCFCPVSSSRPTLADVVGADAIICRKSEEGDTHALPTDRLISLLPTVMTAWPTTGCNSSTDGHDLPWQSSLAQVWKALVLHHLIARNVRSQGGKTQLAPEKIQSLLASGEGGVITILPSMSEALASLQSTTPGQLHVLITGSLYLVGDALQGAEGEAL